MSTSKKLYAGEKKREIYHHSNFLAGGATLAAGRLRVTDGILKGWNQALSMSTGGHNHWALFSKAVLDRTRIALASKAEWYHHLLQPSAEYLGSKLGVEEWVLNIFTEEIIRAGSAASLSSLLNRLDPVLRKTANLGSWQIISPVEAVGYVVVLDELLSVQNRTYEKPTMLVAKSVKGEEEIPDGAVAR